MKQRDDARATTAYTRRAHRSPPYEAAVRPHERPPQKPGPIDSVSGDDPHLVAHECAACRARYFDRRVACAACGGREFAAAPVSTTGEVRAFTIVTFAAPGVPVPFVAALVDCDGTSVRGNLVGVPPDPEHVRIGMEVRLTTFVAGTDGAGVAAVNYGFEPLEG